MPLQTSDIEPFVIEIDGQGVRYNGEYEELRTVCEWLTWWIDHLPYDKLPDGARIVTVVQLPED